MITINIDKYTAVRIDYSVNAVDQCVIDSLIDLNIKPFDDVEVKFNDKTLFRGRCVDATTTKTFADESHSYVINSPLFVLTKETIENETVTFLKLFLQQCCNICGLELDYRLNSNPLINTEKVSYFDMLKKTLIYTKNYNTRFYVDYENNTLVYTDTTDDVSDIIYNVVKYESSWDTDIVNTVEW